MSPNNELSKFSGNLWLTLGMFVLVTITFGFYAYLEKQVDHANELRFQSYSLADELRHSSDDLTRMVRTYVVTSIPIYKHSYQEILDIRDGKKPRPVGYGDIYWDLILASDQRLSSAGPTVSLLDLMRKAGFTEEEFAMLAQAKANSDALTRTEFAAMALIESTVPTTEANRREAIQMLNDKRYHQAKFAIMQPIGEFYKMVEKRTLEAVRAAENVAMLVRWMLIAFGLLLAFTLWRAYRALYATMGCSVDELQGYIRRLGCGDFSGTIPVAHDMENSVLGWLSTTQIELARIDILRKQSEQYEQFRSHTLELLAGDNSLPCVLEAIVRGVEQLDPTMRCSILLLDNEGKHLVHGIAPSLPDFYNAAIDGIEIGMGVGCCGTAAFTGERVIVNDIATYPYWTHYKEIAARAGLGACWSQPILSSSGKVLGTFTIYHHEAHTPDESDIFIIEQTARLASIAIERKQMEDQVRQLAFYDTLTDLPNRCLLNDRLRQTMLTSKRSGCYGALMFLDLDNFKPLNDTHGHDVGDFLLIEAARRLKNCVREMDTVARFGGDEFIVLLSGLDADKDESTTQARIVAQKICTALSAPYLLTIKRESKTETILEHKVTVSIGVVVFVYREGSQSDLIKLADIAMYQAKEAGGNLIRFYDAKT